MVNCFQCCHNFAFKFNLRCYNKDEQYNAQVNELKQAMQAKRDGGGAVQVYPMKPTLKAPGSKRLSPKCEEPLSDFAFKFKLRHYTTAAAAACPTTSRRNFTHSSTPRGVRKISSLRAPIRKTRARVRRQEPFSST
jgi:hypothetical protein